EEDYFRWSFFTDRHQIAAQPCLDLPRSSACYGIERVERRILGRWKNFFQVFCYRRRLREMDPSVLQRWHTTSKRAAAERLSKLILGFEVNFLDLKWNTFLCKSHKCRHGVRAQIL